MYFEPSLRVPSLLCLFLLFPSDPHMNGTLFTTPFQSCWSELTYKPSFSLSKTCFTFIAALTTSAWLAHFSRCEHLCRWVIERVFTLNVAGVGLHFLHFLCLKTKITKMCSDNNTQRMNWYNRKTPTGADLDWELSGCWQYLQNITQSNRCACGLLADPKGLLTSQIALFVHKIKLLPTKQWVRQQRQQWSMDSFLQE